MDKVAIKQYILDHQQTIVDDLMKSMKEFKSEADLDEGETLDPEDYSHQTEYGEMGKRIKEQLTIAKNELEYVVRISTEETEKVDVGALIETKMMSFYVSIATKPFEIDGKQVVGISTNAPIYQILSNKAVGDMLTLGKKEFKIKAIK